MLDTPHHDGSPLHVSGAPSAVGDTVEVRLRVPRSRSVDRVHVRSVRDGEPHWTEATRDGSDDHDTRWVAELVVANALTGYRFLLTDRRGPTWVNGTGAHRREVADAADFRVTTFRGPPDWVHDAVLYQVFPDRFGLGPDAPRPAPSWAVPAAWDDPVVERGPHTPLQWYGGDLPGVEAHLDHVVALGADVLYLCPFFPARSNHRYDAATFDHVDPLLGGDDALAALVGTAHRRGLRVMGDLTTNHTGAAHEWFTAARADAAAPEAGFYLFEEHPDRYACWLGEPSLPKLDHRDPELRRRLIAGPNSVAGRYLTQPFSLDGWRVDVANMTGRHGAVDVNAEVAMTMADTVAATDGYLLAEHFHDAAGDLARPGWHGIMNYEGFLRPVWRWLVGTQQPPSFLGMPTPLAPLGGDLMAARMREVAASVPWAALVASATLLGSHDTARIRTVVGDDDRQVVAAALLVTYPGVPMIFMGDELGLEGIDGEDSRTPMPWSRMDSVGASTHAAYRELLALRRAHPALRRGGLRWARAADGVVAYLRESHSERLLVVAARDAGQAVDVPAALTADRPAVLWGGADVLATGRGWRIEVDGPAAAVLALA